MTYSEYMEYTACNGVDCCNGTPCCGWDPCNGVAGPQGPAGPAGPQGPRGEQGPAGVTPSVTVGTVTPLRPGYTPTVTNTGTAPDVVLNFGLPTAKTSANIADLKVNASDAETVQAVNRILAALRTAGILV